MASPAELVREGQQDLRHWIGSGEISETNSAPLLLWTRAEPKDAGQMTSAHLNSRADMTGRTLQRFSFSNITYPSGVEGLQRQDLPDARPPLALGLSSLLRFSITIADHRGSLGSPCYGRVSPWV